MSKYKRQYLNLIFIQNNNKRLILCIFLVILSTSNVLFFHNNMFYSYKMKSKLVLENGIEWINNKMLEFSNLSELPNCTFIT